MTATEGYFVQSEGPLRQGDILLAGVSRLVGADGHRPPAWDQIEQSLVTIESGKTDGSPQMIAAGPALVMVTSHDCHFDKEWNRRRTALIKSGLDAAEAERLAEEDRTLDRTFVASPLLDPADVDLDQGNLRAGRVVGYLPVPASSDGLVPEAVVDLSYRCTLDRTDVIRVASVGETARGELRYALARLDSLRAVQVGFKVEDVIGRSIVNVEVPKRNPILLRFHLDDGTTVDLLQQPAEPGPGPARSATPSPAP